MIDKPHDCPLCKGTGYRVLGGNDDWDVPYWTECDHTYLAYGTRIIFTGNAATFAFGAVLAAPVCIIMALIAIII